MEFDIIFVNKFTIHFEGTQIPLGIFQQLRPCCFASYLKQFKYSFSSVSMPIVVLTLHFQYLFHVIQSLEKPQHYLHAMQKKNSWKCILPFISACRQLLTSKMVLLASVCARACIYISMPCCCLFSRKSVIWLFFLKDIFFVV